MLWPRHTSDYMMLSGQSLFAAKIINHTRSPTLGFVRNGKYTSCLLSGRSHVSHWDSWEPLSLCLVWQQECFLPFLDLNAEVFMHLKLREVNTLPNWSDDSSPFGIHVWSSPSMHYFVFKLVIVSVTPQGWKWKCVWREASLSLWQTGWDGVRVQSMVGILNSTQQWQFVDAAPQLDWLLHNGNKRFLLQLLAESQTYK